MFTTKKNVLTAMFFCLTFGLFAQISIEEGYVGGGLGFTKLTGDIAEGGSGGFNYFLDAGIYLMPKVVVGIEGNFNLHGYKDANDDVKFRGASLYLAKGEYHFKEDGFVPFAGLGLGVAKIERPGATGIINIEEQSQFNFAISPRVGFVAGGFHMEFVYNLAGKEPTIEGLETFSYNFWVISLGYRYSFDIN